MQTKLKEELSSQLEHHEAATRMLQEQRAGAIERLETQAAAFKEQINQRSMTIVGLEEQLNKAVKEQEDARCEVSELRKKLQGGLEGGEGRVVFGGNVYLYMC